MAPELDRPDVVARVPVGAQDDERRPRRDGGGRGRTRRLRRRAGCRTGRCPARPRSMSALAEGTSRAVPTTVTPGDPWSSAASPSAIAGWSSTIATRIRELFGSDAAASLVFETPCCMPHPSPKGRTTPWVPARGSRCQPFMFRLQLYQPGHPATARTGRRTLQAHEDSGNRARRVPRRGRNPRIALRTRRGSRAHCGGPAGRRAAGARS